MIVAYVFFAFVALTPGFIFPVFFSVKLQYQNRIFRSGVFFVKNKIETAGSVQFFVIAGKRFHQMGNLHLRSDYQIPVFEDDIGKSLV